MTTLGVFALGLGLSAPALADAVATLTAKARAGGSGVYGPIPMPSNPMAKIGDAELKAAVEWILKQ